ncbi:hypothetical protein PRZ48_001668 [Zasmidium cellare]|uniref:Capsule synthesis protein CapA domain-containing protein n=1 Tax=Zasmidium cellare TaxID=395010 RepID=A0ABR0F387_ZASCE|nr:hypothetical protein PRZ48_001668 [Zasmidium cellare]
MSKAGLGDFDQLQSVFEDEVTFVAIDTESERIGLLKHVVEIGISTLDARDVASSVQPGPHAVNWTSCVKHNHIVVTSAKDTYRRAAGSNFAWSALLSIDEAKAKVLEILQSIQPRDGRRKVAFVGHSLQTDLTSLARSPGLQLDLLDSDAMDLDVVANFDTYLLGRLWRATGAKAPDMSLNGLARAAGVNPKCFQNSRLRGWHNASNDAAYTMMVLLQLLAKKRGVEDDSDSSKLGFAMRELDFSQERTSDINDEEEADVTCSSAKAPAPQQCSDLSINWHGVWLTMAGRILKLNFMGDVMLGRLIDQLFPDHLDEPEEAAIVRSFQRSNPKLAGYGPKSPWGNTLPLLESGDLNFINLETAVTIHAQKWPDKVFNYRVHPANIQALIEANIHYAGLANNHTLDFSEEGLRETVQTVREAGIAFAGAGDDEEEARRPAILSPTGSEHQICVWAGSDHPGDWKTVPAFHLIDYSNHTKERLRDLIQKTTPSNASLKIWSCHWGPDYAWQPAQQSQDLAHFMVDECGIDIVHGHSSHHVQGVEVYKGKLIIYGCGDFVDDYALVEGYRNDLSGIWQVHVEERSSGMRAKRLEFYPTKIDRFMARRLEPGEDDSRWVRDKVVQLSAELGTKAVNDEAEGRVIVDIV